MDIMAKWAPIIVLVLGLLLAASSPSWVALDDHPLKGRVVNLMILGISGWLPTTLAMEMAAAKPDTSFSEFSEFAKDAYGYDVSFSFARGIVEKDDALRPSPVERKTPLDWTCKPSLDSGKRSKGSGNFRVVDGSGPS